MTETERIAHYRELAAQFREWAKTEINEEARVGLLDGPGNTSSWRTD